MFINAELFVTILGALSYCKYCYEVGNTTVIRVLVWKTTINRSVYNINEQAIKKLFDVSLDF